MTSFIRTLYVLDASLPHIYCLVKIEKGAPNYIFLPNLHQMQYVDQKDEEEIEK